MLWLIVAAMLVFASPVSAASLNVAPVLLEVTAPGAATVLTLRNDEDRPLNVQIRVFGWQQADGQDHLVSTQDVVVSPPMAVLPPGAEQVVRVLRVSKRPVAGEESYRVLVDELPDAAQRRNGRVKVVLRYSIPVFFAQPAVAAARVNWSIVERNGSWLVEAINSGGRRLRIANLMLKDNAGRTLVQQPGLVGYVLPGASVRWPVGSVRSVKASTTATLSADSDMGPIHAPAVVRAGR